MLLSGLIACTTPPPEERASTDSGWPDSYQAVAPVAVWSGDEAVQAAEAALANGFPNPWNMADVMADYFGEGDYLCPGSGTVLSDASIEGCVSITDWYFMGVGGFMVEEGEDETSSFASAWLMGDMEILGPEGQDLAIGGHWDHLVTVTDGVESWETSTSGTWRASPTELPWLETGVSAWLWTSGERDAETEALVTARLHGALAYDETSLYFDELTWSAGCDQPTGTLRVRDPSGDWFEKTYPASCDPCGPLMFHGEQVADSVCLDLGPYASSMLGNLRP